MANTADIHFGETLKRLRKGRGLSQVEFAELCGISRAYYGRIERGEHSATIEMCQKIADSIGLHIAELFVDMP